MQFCQQLVQVLVSLLYEVVFPSRFPLAPCRQILQTKKKEEMFFLLLFMYMIWIIMD